MTLQSNLLVQIHTKVIDMNNTTRVRLTCKVSDDCDIKFIDGELSIVFERDYEDLDINNPDKLEDTQNDMLWECFTSSLEVIRTDVVTEVENFMNNELTFNLPFNVDIDELDDWNNQQSIVQLCGYGIILYTDTPQIYATPKFISDVTDENRDELEQDFLDYFAEKQQTTSDTIKDQKAFNNYFKKENQ